MEIPLKPLSRFRGPLLRHLRRGGLGLSDNPDGSFKLRGVGWAPNDKLRAAMDEHRWRVAVVLSVAIVCSFRNAIAGASYGARRRVSSAGYGRDPRG